MGYEIIVKSVKKKVKVITGESAFFPGVKLTVNPRLNSVAPHGNPKKMDDAKRIISNLKGPLPWNPNNPY